MLLPNFSLPNMPNFPSVCGLATQTHVSSAGAETTLPNKSGTVLTYSALRFAEGGDACRKLRKVTEPQRLVIVPSAASFTSHLEGLHACTRISCHIGRVHCTHQCMCQHYTLSKNYLHKVWHAPSQDLSICGGNEIRVPKP